MATKFNSNSIQVFPIGLRSQFYNYGGDMLSEKLIADISNNVVDSDKKNYIINGLEIGVDNTTIPNKYYLTLNSGVAIISGYRFEIEDEFTMPEIELTPSAQGDVVYYIYLSANIKSKTVHLRDASNDISTQIFNLDGIDFNTNHDFSDIDISNFEYTGLSLIIEKRERQGEYLLSLGTITFTSSNEYLINNAKHYKFRLNNLAITTDKSDGLVNQGVGIKKQSVGNWLNNSFIIDDGEID